MEEVITIAVSVALFVAGCVGWHTLWCRRIEARLEKVPVRDGRSAHVLQRDTEFDGGSR